MSLIRLTNHEIIKVMRYLVLVLAFITAWHASALILTSPNDLVLSISPASPKAGQTITATAKSFAFDAARANFRWLLNGKEIAQVKPGDTLILLEEQGVWFRIRLPDGTEGFVSSSYVEKKKP